MKGKTKAISQYKLSPNEEARLLKEETERRRKLRIQQVRQQSKANAARIRKAVKDEKNRQIENLAADVRCEWEEEKQEKIIKLEEAYRRNVREVGTGHQEAEDVDAEGRDEYKLILEQEGARKADLRGHEAMDKLRKMLQDRDMDANKILIARQVALELEKARAAEVAGRPPPKPDPLDILDKVAVRSIPVTDLTAFNTTHYHIPVGVDVERAKTDEDDETAKMAAVTEGERYNEAEMQRKSLITEQHEKARLRHKHALHKEVLKQDYDKLLLDLSDLQRADQVRRQKVVADIPKQIFLPPHRRLEEKADAQNDMERAFEDMYLAATDYIGDLSLALDPHPPPATPSVTETLELSTLGEPMDEAEEEEEGVDRKKEEEAEQEKWRREEDKKISVLSDLTNISRSQIIDRNKTPDEGLKKILGRIRSQRENWMSRSSEEDTKTDSPGSALSTHRTITQHTNTSFSSESTQQSTASKTTEPTLTQYTISSSEATQSKTSSVEGERNGMFEESLEEGTITTVTSEEKTVTGKQDTLLHPLEKAAKIRNKTLDDDSEMVRYLEEGRKKHDVIRRENDDIRQETEMRQQQILEQKRKLEQRLTEIMENKRALEEKMLDVSSHSKKDAQSADSGHRENAEYDGAFKRPLPPHVESHRPHGQAEFPTQVEQKRKLEQRLTEIMENKRALEEKMLDVSSHSKKDAQSADSGHRENAEYDGAFKRPLPPHVESHRPHGQAEFPTQVYGKDRNQDQGFGASQFQHQPIRGFDSGHLQQKPIRSVDTTQQPITSFDASSLQQHPIRSLDSSQKSSPKDLDTVRAYQQKLLSRQHKSGPEQLREARLELQRKAEELLRTANEDFLGEPRISQLGQFQDVDIDKSPSDTDVDKYYSRQSLTSIPSARHSHGSRESGVSQGESQYMALPVNLDRVSGTFEAAQNQRNLSHQYQPQHAPTAQYPRPDFRQHLADAIDEDRARVPDVPVSRAPYQASDRVLHRPSEPGYRSQFSVSANQFKPYSRPEEAETSLRPLPVQPGRFETSSRSLNASESASGYQDNSGSLSRPYTESDRLSRSPQSRGSSPKRALSDQLSPERPSSRGLEPAEPEDDITHQSLHDQLAEIRRQKQEILERQARQREELAALRNQWQQSLTGEEMLDVSQKVRERREQSPTRGDSMTESDEPTPIDLLNPSYMSPKDREELLKNTPPRGKLQTSPGQSPNYWFSKDDVSSALASIGEGQEQDMDNAQGKSVGHGYFQGEGQAVSQEPGYSSNRDGQSFGQSDARLEQDLYEQDGRRPPIGYAPDEEQDAYEPHELSTIKEDDTPVMDEEDVAARSLEKSDKEHREEPAPVMMPKDGYVSQSVDDHADEKQTGYYTAQKAEEPKVYKSLDDFKGAYQPFEGGITLWSSDEKEEHSGSDTAKRNEAAANEGKNESEDAAWKPSRNWNDALAEYSISSDSKHTSTSSKDGGEAGNLEDRLRDVYNAMMKAASDTSNQDRTEPVSVRSLPGEDTDPVATASSESWRAGSLEIHKPAGSFNPLQSVDDTQSRQFFDLALDDDMSEYRRQSRSPVLGKSRSQPIDSSTPAKPGQTKVAERLSPTSSIERSVFDAANQESSNRREKKDTTASSLSQYGVADSRSHSASTLHPYHETTDKFHTSGSLSQHPIGSTSSLHRSALTTDDISPKSDTNSAKSTELTQYPYSENSASLAKNGRSIGGSTTDFMVHGRPGSETDYTFPSFKSSGLDKESPLFHSTYDSAKIQQYAGSDYKGSGSSRRIEGQFSGLQPVGLSDRTDPMGFSDSRQIGSLGRLQEQPSAIYQPMELSVRREPIGSSDAMEGRKSPTVRFATQTDVRQMSSRSSSEQQLTSSHSKNEENQPLSADELSRRVEESLQRHESLLQKSRQTWGGAVSPTTDFHLREIPSAGDSREFPSQRESQGSLRQIEIADSSLQQLQEESGITEEANLTLVSLSSTTQPPTPNERSPYQRGDSGAASMLRAGDQSSSLVSFEQHEQSLQSTGSFGKFSPLAPHAMSPHDPSLTSYRPLDPSVTPTTKDASPSTWQPLHSTERSPDVSGRSSEVTGRSFQGQLSQRSLATSVWSSEWSRTPEITGRSTTSFEGLGHGSERSPGSKEVRFRALTPETASDQSEGLVSVPVVQVEGSKEDNYEGLSLAEAFAKRRSDFEAASKRRQEEAKRKAQEKTAAAAATGQKTGSHHGKVLSSWKQTRALNGKAEDSIPKKAAGHTTKTGSDRKYSEKEMKERTSRLYSMSEESRKKKEEEDRKKQYQANREKAKEYHKKQQEKRKKKDGK